MSFATGLLLIDAPASALNNLGSIPGARTDNTVGVKVIKAKDGQYPYVSAQAFRYWLRTTLEAADDLGWQAAPTYREEKVAYTDANPILYWDDDLFGYMRAPGTGTKAKKARQDDPKYKELTSLDVKEGEEQAVTRVSPFRVSTLVSIAPVLALTEDFGTMSRHEGDPVPHEHQFYRATLKGLFSLDLHASGTFSSRNRTGFRNLDNVRVDIAKARDLEHREGDKSYRLPTADRVQRISALFDGLARLQGGAKQALHYTDVAPAFVILAVTRGGNHIFGHVVGATSRGLPELKHDALREALTVFADDILSPVYLGWTQGYLDDERARFQAALAEGGALAGFKARFSISHPREAFQALANDLRQTDNAAWLA